MRGFFITLEGIDGCGKSTQAERLAAALLERGYAVLTTRQPGGTAIGKHIRALMIEEHSRLSPVAEVLLMMADRAQHVHETIKPQLEAGRIIISDRYIDSSVAFQGYGRGLEISTVEALNHLATDGLLPDLTLLFELNREAAQARLAARTGKQLTDNAPMTGFDEEQHDFHQRVHQGYLQLAARHPERIRIVDADASVDEVHERVMALVLERLQDLGIRI